MLLAILAGLAAGAIHVLTGPDHLVAVAPLAVAGRRRPWLSGLWWGTGHSGGVWIVGLLALLLRELLPLESLSAWSERFVGVILIAIGLWSFRKALSRHLHAHEHTHDGVRHRHLHLHTELVAGHEVPERETTGPEPDSTLDQPAVFLRSSSARKPAAHQHHPHAHTHAAVFVGALHGLAGSSHFFGILPALALPGRVAALSYILAFGLGSIVAMTAFSWLLGVTTAKFGGAGVRSYRWLMAGCGAAAIGVGGFWLVS